MGGEDAVALGAAPAHPAPELMELAQTEPVRVLDHHQGSVGHIHANFDDGSGHQHIRLALGKAGHNLLLLHPLHLAVEQGHPQVREDGLLQGLCPGGGGLHVQLLVLLHRRAHHKALVPFGYLLADEGVDPGPVALPYQEGLHRLPSRGQLIQHGDLQVAIHQKGQGPGDGRCRHDQQMGGLSLGGKLAALTHAEAVLLIGDDKAQILKFGAVGDQGVGTHRQIGLAGGNGLPGLPLLLACHGSGQQHHPDAHRGKKPGQGPVVLLCQYLRWGHQGTLDPVFRGAVNRSRRHHGLAAAHVSLDQAVHRCSLPEILQDPVNGPPLGPGEGKGQGGIKGLHIPGLIGRDLFQLPGRPHQAETGGKDEKLLKYQPPLGLLRLLGILGGVDGPVGRIRRKNVIFLPDLRGENFPGGIADGQGLGNQLCHGGVGEPGGKGVDGHDPPGGHRLGIRTFKQRIRHAVAGKVPGEGAVEDILPAILQVLRGKPGVEEGQGKPAGVVRHLDPGQIQSLADVGRPWGAHDCRPEAGRLVHIQLRHAGHFRPVLIAPGKMADEVSQGEDIQRLQQLFLCGAYALQCFDRIRQPCHSVTFLYHIIDIPEHPGDCQARQRTGSQ